MERCGPDALPCRYGCVRHTGHHLLDPVDVQLRRTHRPQPQPDPPFVHPDPTGGRAPRSLPGARRGSRRHPRDCSQSGPRRSQPGSARPESAPPNGACWSPHSGVRLYLDRYPRRDVVDLAACSPMASHLHLVGYTGGQPCTGMAHAHSLRLTAILVPVRITFARQTDLPDGRAMPSLVPADQNNKSFATVQAQLGSMSCTASLGTRTSHVPEAGVLNQEGRVRALVRYSVMSGLSARITSLSNSGVVCATTFGPKATLIRVCG